MPFKNFRQLQTCFGRQISAESRKIPFTWNCKEWAEQGCKKHRRKECISGLFIGPQNGLYFYVDGVKVYVPKGERERKYAIQKYGQPKIEKKTKRL